MGFKKIETGIYSYYKNSDQKKKHQAYYYSTTGATGKTVKVKSQHTDIRKVRAERVGADLNIKVNDGEVSSNSTLDEITDLYISSKNKKPMSKHARNKYNKHIRDTLGNKVARTITQVQVTRLEANIEAKSIQSRELMIILKSLLTFANNPTVTIKIPKPNHKRKHYFNEDELKLVFRMAKQLDQELYVFMMMLLYTAQRGKNVLDVSVDDVDLRRNKIDFKEIKGQEAEYIAISDKLRPVLEEWIKGKNGKLFTRNYDWLNDKARPIFEHFNRPLYYVDGMSAKDEAKVKQIAFKTKRHKWATFYSLRHTACVNIIKNTGSVFQAQQMLRHSDIKMTMTYSQLVEKDIQRTANAI